MNISNGQKMVGPYLIQDKIGVGGTGTVYLAFDERLERQVAIKHFKCHPRDIYFS